MEFTARWRVLVLVLWAVCGSVAGTMAQGVVEARVFVYNDAGVSGPVLAAGEAEASRIFELAGVRLRWTNCVPGRSSEGQSCVPLLGAQQFVVRVLPKARASADLIFGQAFLDEAGSGKYADIFFDRIQTARDQFGTNVAQLLGAVVTHELGHLLLGVGAHSRVGIMIPVWKRECLSYLSMGNLLFTTDQARRIQARLGQNIGMKLARDVGEGSDTRPNPAMYGFVSLNSRAGAPTGPE